MTSPYADLTRPPLSAAAVAAALRHGDAADRWREVRVVPATESTNADVAAAARAGAAEGLVLVAEHQTAGRGRLDRTWVSPPRAGLTMSLLLRPTVAQPAWALLPMLVATATASAVEQRTGVEIRLKWPNDLLAGRRKVAGLLAELAGDAVVVGVGINVSNRRDELPRGDATSLALEADEPVDRLPLLLAILRAVAAAYDDWLADGGAAGPVVAAYRSRSATIGRDVRVELPGGAELVGRASDVDDAGRLLVDAATGVVPVSAGDVVHLRQG